ncbi:hypothetical protein ACP4OV_016431 [Aristida adscensionis]
MAMANGMQQQQQQQGSIPRIDFAGIDPAAGGGGATWAAVRAAVMDALRTHGCFEAAMDGLIAPELHAAVLGAGGAAESVLRCRRAPRRGTPPTRCTTATSAPSPTYSTRAWASPTRSRSTPCAPSPTACGPTTTVPTLTSANESVHAYAGKVAVLEATVRRMVLESVGATAEYMDELGKSTAFLLRLSEYAAGAVDDGKLGLSTHRDPGILAVISQNDVDGLEVECRRGEDGWARPSLSGGSFLVVAGDMLTVLTNGQVYNPAHRMMPGDETRYSSVFFCIPSDGATVSAIDEAVDAGRSALFRPFKFREYLKFSFTPENLQLDDKLQAFAAVPVDG